MRSGSLSTAAAAATQLGRIARSVAREPWLRSPARRRRGDPRETSATPSCSIAGTPRMPIRAPLDPIATQVRDAIAAGVIGVDAIVRHTGLDGARSLARAALDRELVPSEEEDESEAEGQRGCEVQGGACQGERQGCAEGGQGRSAGEGEGRRRRQGREGARRPRRSKERRPRSKAPPSSRRSRPRRPRPRRKKPMSPAKSAKAARKEKARASDAEAERWRREERRGSPRR